jgi:hypothetical protein
MLYFDVYDCQNIFRCDHDDKTQCDDVNNAAIRTDAQITTIMLLVACLTCCHQERMILLDAFKASLGFSADSSTNHIDVADSSSDGSFNDDDMLTTLRSVRGQNGSGQRGSAVIQNDTAGEVHSPAANSNSRHNIVYTASHRLPTVLMQLELMAMGPIFISCALI